MLPVQFVYDPAFTNFILFFFLLFINNEPKCGREKCSKLNDNENEKKRKRKNRKNSNMLTIVVLFLSHTHTPVAQLNLTKQKRKIDEKEGKVGK